MAVFFEYAAMPITDPIAARICDLFFENSILELFSLINISSKYTTTSIGQGGFG